MTAVEKKWGGYEVLQTGPRYQVKCLVVKPGHRMSVQYHHHRAEHWVVAKGVALVKLAETERLLFEGQSVYIALGATHSVENPGRIDLVIIETQLGSYTGEDDIVRLSEST